jgi:hypothetical protein
MYIHCDVAPHAIVGGAKTPLLLICNVIERFCKVVRNTYERPHYVPVGRREFDSIEIGINNEPNESIPLEFGKSIVTSLSPITMKKPFCFHDSRELFERFYDRRQKG